jgi:septal ring factor EnvC (AmiA/AmiB activator)
MREKLSASIAYVGSSIADLRAQLAEVKPSAEADEVRQRLDACEAYLASWAHAEPTDTERLAVLAEVLHLTQRVMDLRPLAFDAAATERVLPSLEDVNSELNEDMNEV